jgi:hypothetical protein
VDFGHGDWEMWENFKFENVSYIGFDVANNLSEMVQAKYGNSHRSFRQIDSTEKDLPNADLLITKDVLQHITNQEVENFLKKMSSYKYVIICNDLIVSRITLSGLRNRIALKKRINLIRQLKIPKLPKRLGNNVEISIGQFRGIDLEALPFKYHLGKSTIIKTLDYDGPKRFGIVKRIYLISNL